MRALRTLAAAAALLFTAPALAQQSVPYFPQTLQSGQFVGRLSSGPGPTEAISTAALLNALFPGGSAAFAFNAASVAYQGSVSGVVTVQAQAAAGTWTLQWPTSQGTANQCLITTPSGSIATTSWSSCAGLASNNTWSGTQTFNGNITVASLANFTGTFQKGGTTQTFPGSGSIVGTSDTQTLTNKSIDASEVNTGNFGYSRLPGAINANLLITKNGNYTINTSTDCGSSISGTGGPWTITLPAAPTSCVVQVCNQDPNDASHHAIRLSGFPAPSLGRLWMQQCEEVTAVNSAWVVTKWPGKFRPGFIPTLFVDTGGSDSNDGLVSNAAANALANPQTCWTIFQREMDLGTAQPTCSPTGGQTFNGGVNCSSAGTPNVYFLVGNGGRAVIRNTGGNFVVSESDFCGYIIFDNVNIDCTSAASHPCDGLFIHQQNGADLSTSGFTNGVTFTGGATSDTAVLCDSVGKVNTGALVTISAANGMNAGFNGTLGCVFNISFGISITAGSTFGSSGIVQVTNGAQLIWSGPLTVGAGSALTGDVFHVGANSTACLNLGTVTGTFTGFRQWQVLNNGLLTNLSANAVPGSAGINTAAGFAAGVIGAATSGSGC